MILLDLFLVFLEIGAVSFGGGYGMISLMREKALAFGWMTEEELLNVIAVAESTPGPIAVNMATFVGSRQGGMLGALLSTLGVILPSFIIILLIAALIKNFLKYTGVKAFLSGVRPCVVGAHTFHRNNNGAFKAFRNRFRDRAHILRYMRHCHLCVAYCDLTCVE